MSVGKSLLLGLALVVGIPASGEALRSGDPISAGPRGLPEPSRRIDRLVLPSTFERVDRAKPFLPETAVVGKEVVAKEATGARNKVAPEASASLSELPPALPASTTAPVGLKLQSSASPQPPLGERAGSAWQEMVAWRPSSNQLVTTGSGLVAVLGLVLIAAWVAKKCMPRASRALPTDVAEVLGRVVLGGRQTAQLVRLGNKLVLVSVTPDGAETLTEVTDPEEVQRLVQRSEEALGRGSSADFNQVFQQMASEEAPHGFLGDEAEEAGPFHYDAQRLAAAYSDTPGGRGHG